MSNSEFSARILKDVCWNIYEPICNIKRIVRKNPDIHNNPDNLQISGDYPFDTKISHGNYIYIQYCVDRCGELLPVTKKYKSRENANGFTAGDILEHIYRFYTSEIPHDECVAISLTNDPFNYFESAKDALKNSSVLYRERIMGSLTCFEGLKFVRMNGDIPMYEIMLGS